MTIRKLIFSLFVIVFMVAVITQGVFAVDNYYTQDHYIPFDDVRDVYTSTCSASGGKLNCNGQNAYLVHNLWNASLTGMNGSFEMVMSIITLSNTYYTTVWHTQNLSTGTVANRNFRLTGTVGNIDYQTLSSIPSSMTPGNTYKIKGIYSSTHTTFYINNTRDVTVAHRVGYTNDFLALECEAGGCNVAYDSINLSHWVNGTTPPSVSTIEKFTITAKDLYDNTSLNNLSVRIYNTTASTNTSTMNGTILFLNNTNVRFGGNYNITFSVNDSGGYFDRTYSNIFINDTLSLQGKSYQSILIVNGYKGIVNTSVTGFNLKTGTNITTATTSATVWLKAGSYTTTGSATEYINSSKSFSISALETKYINLTFYNGQIKVNASSLIDGSGVNSFTITLNDLNRSYSQTQTATAGTLIFNVTNSNYNLSFSSFTNAAANKTVIYGWQSNRYNNITFKTYTTNSINISIYDEILGRTNFMSGKTVNFEFVSDVISYNYSTNNSQLYVDLLIPSEYKITYWTDNFKKRDYYFTLTNATHNELELYLLSNGNSTDIEITVNDNSNIEIENALIQLKRYYVDTNSYRIVTMSKTNVEGKVIINVDYDDPYYILVASSGSSITTSNGAKIFTSTITMVIDTSASPYADIDTANNLYSTLKYNNNTKTFTFTAQDLGGTSRLFTLNVYKDTVAGSTLLCSNSDTSASTSILCQVNQTNETGSYRAVGLVKGSIDIVVKMVSLGVGKGKNIFGNSGIFWTIIFAGTLGGLGALGGPVPAILLFLVGLFAGFLFELTVINIGMMMGISIIGVMIVYKMRK